MRVMRGLARRSVTRVGDETRLPDRKGMRAGFVIVGAITVLAETVAIFTVVGWPLSLQVLTASPLWIALHVGVHSALAAIAGFISWRVLWHEHQAGHPPFVIDAAAGPLAVAVVFGIPFVVLPVFLWFISLSLLALGLLMSSAGYYFVARSALVTSAAAADRESPRGGRGVRMRGRTQ